MRIALPCLIALTGCLPTDPSETGDAPTWQDPRDDADTSAPPAPFDMGPTRSVNDRDFLPAALLAIDAANQHIRVAQYLLYDDARVDPVYDALARAARRGVHVQVLADETGSDTEQVIAELGRRGIDAKLDSPRVTLHAKLIIADDVALLGSHNFTGAALHSNAEASLLVVDADATAAVSSWFDALWDAPDSVPSLPATDAALRPVADPELTEVLTTCIDSAVATIDVQMYAIAWDDRYPGSDVDRILTGLAAASARGVAVTVNVDASDWIVDNAINDDAIARLVADEIDVWTTDPDITSHAKVLRCDDTIIVSDANWSYSGLSLMRGVSLRANDAALAEAYSLWMAGKRQSEVQ